VRPDAVVLDILLPDIDGLEVLHPIRAESPELPVPFLTARDSVTDRVSGLDAGGDDHMTMPFSIEELLARLRRLMRRTSTLATSPGATLVVGELSLDEDSWEVRRAGEPISLIPPSSSCCGF
jgi:two-component system OmpR family response regulator